MKNSFGKSGPSGAYCLSLDLFAAYERAGVLLVEAEPSEKKISDGIAAGASSEEDAIAIYKAMTRDGK